MRGEGVVGGGERGTGKGDGGSRGELMLAMAMAMKKLHHGLKVYHLVLKRDNYYI